MHPANYRRARVRSAQSFGPDRRGDNPRERHNNSSLSDLIGEYLHGSARSIYRVRFADRKIAGIIGFNVRRSAWGGVGGMLSGEVTIGDNYGGIPAGVDISDGGSSAEGDYCTKTLFGERAGVVASSNVADYGCVWVSDVLRGTHFFSSRGGGVTFRQ